MLGIIAYCFDFHYKIEFDFDRKRRKICRKCLENFKNQVLLELHVPVLLHQQSAVVVVKAKSLHHYSQSLTMMHLALREVHFQ